MLYRLSKGLAYWFLKIFYKLEVKGTEVIPKTGSFILASNHLSNLDPPTLAVSSPRKIGFITKEELFENKLLALYLRGVGAISVKRGKSGVGVMRLVLRTLKAKPLLIFPQGARGEGFTAANSGIGFFYKKTGVPIIAARIYGTDKILPKGAKFFRKGRIKVIFDRVDNIEKSDSYEDVTQKVMNKIASLS